MQPVSKRIKIIKNELNSFKNKSMKGYLIYNKVILLQLLPISSFEMGFELCDFQSQFPWTKNFSTLIFFFLFLIILLLFISVAHLGC